jgi:AcrR family transcriptional regulator
MPKQTFLNLSEEKRNTLIATAIEEFANNDYNTASISKIVEKAGIAKGSVYQYFEDKQDLFMYLMDVSNKAMLEFITQSTPPNPGADFFEVLRWQMSATVQAAVKYPVHSKLLRRAYSTPLPFRDEVFERSKKLGDEHFQAMIAQAQAGGQLDAKRDPEIVSFVVRGLMSELGVFMQDKFKDRKQKKDWVTLPEVDAVFDEVVAILKNGLGK